MKRAIWSAIAVAVAAVVVAVVVVAGHNGPVDSVEDLSKGDCDDAHDGEVLASFTLSARQAAGYTDAVPNEVCVDELDDTGSTAVTDMSLLLAGVSDARAPRAGDTLACLAFKADGSRLDGRVRTR